MTQTSDLRSQETLPAIVNRMAETCPDEEFVRTVEGASATWDQLRESMVLWAARLLALDVKEGDVVVTLLDAGLESLVLWLGLSSVGATMPQRIPSSVGACSHTRSTTAGLHCS